MTTAANTAAGTRLPFTGKVAAFMLAVGIPALLLGSWPDAATAAGWTSMAATAFSLLMAWGTPGGFVSRLHREALCAGLGIGLLAAVPLAVIL